MISTYIFPIKFRLPCFAFTFPASASVNSTPYFLLCVASWKVLLLFLSRLRLKLGFWLTFNVTHSFENFVFNPVPFICCWYRKPGLLETAG